MTPDNSPDDQPVAQRQITPDEIITICKSTRTRLDDLQNFMGALHACGFQITSRLSRQPARHAGGDAGT